MTARKAVCQPLSRVSDCVHRWRFEEACGPVSRGVCLLCGAERVGSNAFVGDIDRRSWREWGGER